MAASRRRPLRPIFVTTSSLLDRSRGTTSSTTNREVAARDADGNKGYAFVECEHMRTAARILEVPSHFISGRKVVVTEALGKKSKAPKEELANSGRRLFVGGLVPKCTSGGLFSLR